MMTLRVKSIDVQHSEWPCTVEHEVDGSLSLRIGLKYAKRLRNISAEAIIQARGQDGLFQSAEDLALRVPRLDKRELTLLAYIGALNEGGIMHRRDALWQIERSGKKEGPLFRQNGEWLRNSPSAELPLSQMNAEERLIADYAGTDLTIGKHPMYYCRAELLRQGVRSAAELRECRDGELVRTAGSVIARQRPGTAKGVISLSMEDETGIANIIVEPNLYEQDRMVLTRSKFLVVHGGLQNQDNVIHIKANRVMALPDGALELISHDFH